MRKQTKCKYANISTGKKKQERKEEEEGMVTVAQKKKQQTNRHTTTTVSQISVESMKKKREHTSIRYTIEPENIH